MSWPAARGLRRRVRVTFEIPEKATSPSSWRKRHVMFFHVFFFLWQTKNKQNDKQTNQKQSLNLEQKDIFFQQIVVVFCSSRLRDQWDLFCDIDIWPTKNLKTSSESRPPCWEQVVAPLSLQVWLPVPCPWHEYHSNPLRCNCFRGSLPWESWGRSGCSLSDPWILKINTMGDSGDHPTMSLLWINKGTADCSYDYFKTSRCLMFDRFKWFKHPKEKNAMPNHAKSMYFPNGWEVLPASWFSRTNSSSNDGPALVIWLRSDMVPFLASSCQFSPMAFLGFDSNTTSNRKSNKSVKQKTNGTPCSQCSHASDVERLSLILQTSWKHATHLPRHHLSMLHCVFWQPHPVYPPPFENVDPRREKGLKQVPKKNENTELLQRLFNMFLGPGVVPRLLEVNLWKQTVFVDPLMSRVPSQRKGSSNKNELDISQIHFTLLGAGNCFTEEEVSFQEMWLYLKEAALPGVSSFHWKSLLSIRILENSWYFTILERKKVHAHSPQLCFGK